MSECNAIIEANNEIDRLKKENEKLNALCVQYGFDMGELEEEYEQCKQAYQTLKSRHSLLHDECLEAECDRDSLKKDVISLEKENEQLKQQNELLKNTIESLTEQLAHGIEDLMSDD